jgi:uncharacterized membrane protein
MRLTFLERPRNVVAAFTTCGLLDITATILLVKRLGHDAEFNPLVRYGLSTFDVFYGIPHMLLVGIAALLLSRPMWNDHVRFKIKSVLFVLYGYVVLNNWLQLTMIGVESIPSQVVGMMAALWLR